MTHPNSIPSTLDLSSLLHRAMVRQAIDRDWRACLDVFEYSIVTFIYDRTISWGKRAEIISITEFCEGREGYFSGTGMSRAKLNRCLTQLVHRGIIHRAGNNTHRKRYGLNLEWTPKMSLPPRKTDTKLGSPRAQLGSHRAENTPQLGSHRDPLRRTSSKKDLENETERAAPSVVRSRERPVSTLKEVEASVLKEAAGRRAVVSQSRDVNDVQREWEGLMREHWPEALLVPWSPKCRGLYKTAVKNKAFHDVRPFEFLEWVVSEWGLITKGALSWMKSSPAYPHPEFVMVHLYRLLPLYADRVSIRRAFDEHGVDALQSAMRRRGYSADDAETFARKKRGGPVKSEEAEQLERERRAIEQEKKLVAQQRRHLSALTQNTPVDKTPGRAVGSGLSPLPSINYDEDL